MARASMADLLTRLRRMIGDRGTSPHWTDDELQDALDNRRETVNWFRLTPVEFYPGGGHAVEWHDFYAGDPQNAVGDWENSITLTDASFNPLTPDTSELIAGHWFFVTSIGSLVVYLNGTTYDLAAAAADVLENWAAELARNYDVERRSIRYVRSQASTAMLRQAQTFRAMQRPQNFQLTRSDRYVDDDRPC